MKKFLAILMAICMVATMLCVPTFAAETRAAGTVLRVSAQKGNLIEVLEDYVNFEDGWNYAMEIASDEDEMREKGYSRIVVDIYANWKADDGDFGSGDGFGSGAIKFPEDARATLNLNGHTIDRDLSDWEWNGEVIYVDENANVIINSGTITGGWSGGGAGGIHIYDGARVELNNVTIKDNTSDDDDGGGIAVYDGATLTMNGGSFVDNELNGKEEAEGIYYYGGAVYVEDSTATFNGVTFKNNYTENNRCFGAAIYAADSNVNINGCTFDGNGHKGATKAPMSTIHADDSTITVKGSTFVENGDKRYSQMDGEYSAVFMLDNSTLTMEKGEANNRFSGNLAHFLFNDVDDSKIFVSDTDFVDNASAVLYGDDDSSADNYFKNCTFKNNKNDKFVSFYGVSTPLTFIECDMGDSTYGDKSYLEFANDVVQAPGEKPAEGTVLRVSALKRSGESVVIKDYTDFAEGWEFAIDFAENEDEMSKYSRVIVDLYADWKANAEGEFGEGGDGFEWSTIDIPGDIRITINMNGYTINRDLKIREYDGEVIHISGGADVIINDGTITGGWSENGAGGLHIKGDAKVTLNNVNIVGNASRNDGGGIEVGSNATLTVNGGSFKNNTIFGEVMTYAATPEYRGGAVFVNGGSAVFNNVEFKGNNAPNDTYDYGAAIFVDEGDATINNCIFDENGIKGENDASISIIHGVESVIRVTGSTFTGNGGEETGTDICKYSSIFVLDESELFVDSTEFIGNLSYFIINDEDESYVSISNTKFLNNKSAIMRGDSDSSHDSFFDKCVFDNNVSSDGYASFYNFTTDLTFYNCSMGNCTYNSTARIKFINDNPDSDATVRISALKNDGTIVKIKDHWSFDDGWNDAIALALDSAAMKANGYDRIVFDMYTDWNAVDGQFTDEFSNGVGFNWDAIYIPQNVRITINMNGHTINRGLTDNEANGEVIYVDEDADVIINGGSDGDPIARGDDTNAKFGTISGGYSHNGAGGIHINSNAKVTLNNVRVDGNSVEDDDGSAMAVYDGATLIMNGGSISNNALIHSGAYYGGCYGGLFLNKANAFLTDVLITDNGTWGLATGAGVYMVDSHVTMKNCYILKNVYIDESKNFGNSSTIICVKGSTSILDITDTMFENNGEEDLNAGGVIGVEDGALKVNNCQFLNNATVTIIGCEDAAIEITNSRFEGNVGRVFGGEVKEGSHFTNCTFSENTKHDGYVTFKLYYGEKIAFNNCDLGNSTFNDRSRATFDGKDGVGSIFGEGSLSMIFAILSLIASGVAIFLVVYYNKKNAVPAIANNAAETDEK